MGTQKSIILHIDTTGDGILNESISVSAFRYESKRMGGAPSITLTLMYHKCLDSLWSENVYAEFNGEKYFLKNTPTSSKNNEDGRYSHSITLVSERVVLDNVFFYDTVIDNPNGYERVVSNSTKFSFYGNIEEFAYRLNQSLIYRKLQTKDQDGSILGFNVVLDKGIDTTENKFVSFEDKVFSEAIQELYNTYGIPYYFVGKTIHIGHSSNSIEEAFEYGAKNALLSVTKTNANAKVVNRITGNGSSDNIPYYYPNNSPKGVIKMVYTSSSAVYKVVDMEKFSNEVTLEHPLKYSSGEASNISIQQSLDGISYEPYTASPMTILCVAGQTKKVWYRISFKVTSEGDGLINGRVLLDGVQEDITKYIIHAEWLYRGNIYNFKTLPEGVYLRHLDVGSYTVTLCLSFGYRGTAQYHQYTMLPYFNVDFDRKWYDEVDGRKYTLADMGMSITSGSETIGDTITQKLVEYIKPSDVLLPSIYRSSKGMERFYEALNGRYTDEDGNAISFNNIYVDDNPKEHIEAFEDIRPTIKGAKNSSKLNMDMFSEFAYDYGDDDGTYTDEEGNTYYTHPYFFAKLRKLDFNLFDSASEKNSMKIEMTSGHCGACSFEISVDEDTQKNTVQVYEGDVIDDDGTTHLKGSLKRDENGRVVCGMEHFQPKVTNFQDCQQNTIDNEVWIALKKDEDTYGVLLPNNPILPKACTNGNNDGDTFIITGINLPDSYIQNAEKRLENELIKFMSENNDEKFKFDIKFSRIYFEENLGILETLNENSKIKVRYNGVDYPLYVSSYTYQMSEGDVLPQVSISLEDSVTVSSNTLQKTINAVKAEFTSVAEDISKDVQGVRASSVSKSSVSSGDMSFPNGVELGNDAKIEPTEDGSSRLKIGYLEVTKRAVFSSVSIAESTYVGGQIIVSSASMNCNKVEDGDGYYRCYFQSKDSGGGTNVINQFVIGDLATCRNFNSTSVRYYWREVVGVGDDYIDLSKTSCDEGSMSPISGDKIIQLGNRSDTERQSAIILSAYGSNSPYSQMYTGINTFSLEGKEVSGNIYRNRDGNFEAYFFNYGSSYIGSKNKVGDYLEYDNETGELTIKANVVFKASQSLEDIDAFKDVSDKVDGNTASIKEINTALGDINVSVGELDYIKKAIIDGNTQVIGGLILSSLIQLGFKEGDAFKIMSGINGIYNSDKFGGGVASWFGGRQYDREHLGDGESEEDSAKSLFRFDGSGYLAEGNITWDKNGYGGLGGGLLTWGKNENGTKYLKIADEVKFGASDSVESILAFVSKFNDMFDVDSNGDIFVKNGKGFYTDGFIASGGKGSSSGGSGGGSAYVQWYLDNILAMTVEEGEELGNLAAAYAVKEAYERLTTTSIPVKDIEKLFGN